MGSPGAGASAVERELAVIFSTDAVRYSSLMEEDEEGTLAQLGRARSLIYEVIREHGGRPFGAAGDGFMAEFKSSVAAVRAAIRIQHGLAELNAVLSPERRLQFRIGINVGDVMVEGDGVFGDGVNIAARLQALAEPGGLCVSRAVYEQVHNKVDLAFRSAGAQTVKNIATPIHVYKARVDERASVRRRPRPIARGTVAAMAVLLIAGAAFQSKSWWTGSRLAQPEASAGQVMRLPSLLVMPIEVLGNDADLVLLADGLTSDLTTDLGRFRSLLVFGRDTARSYQGRPMPVSAVAQELKAQYVVEGSCQRSGDRLRVNVRLIEGGSGRQLWAERWDRGLSDFLVLQSDLAEAVVIRLPIEVAQVERAQLRSRHNGDLQAYRLWLEARQLFDEPTRENNEAARKLLQEALARDPGFTRALGHLSYTYVQDYQYGWAEDPDAARRTALDLAMQALKRDPNDYDNHWSVAIARTQLGELDQALDAYRHAVELNPNDTKLRAEMSDALVAAGRYDEAVAQVTAALERDPAGPSWYSWNLGYAYLIAGRADEAVAAFEGRPDLPDEALADMAAAYALRGKPGDQEQAAGLMARYRTINPENSLAEVAEKPLAVEADKRRYLDALQRAGLPAS